MDQPSKLEKAVKTIPVIRVSRERCKGCEFCVTFCPKSVLEMEGRLAVAVRSKQCTRCEFCVWVCPDFAIIVD